MLSLFSIAILRARSLQGDHLPCGCFGGARKLDYRTMLSRNAFLGALSGIVLLGSGDVAPTTPSVPSSGEILPAALVLIGCALVAWIAWQATHSLGRRTDS
jgi:hypothetical protein